MQIFHFYIILTCALHLSTSVLCYMLGSRFPEIKFFIKRPDLASFSDDDKLNQSTALQVIVSTSELWQTIASFGYKRPLYDQVPSFSHSVWEYTL